jgi:hypothetical protein
LAAVFAALPEVHAWLFEPVGTPAAKATPVGTPRPKLTPARALLIRLMDAYAALDYTRSLLEVQKLAYFLQAAGDLPNSYLFFTFSINRLATPRS